MTTADALSLLLAAVAVVFGVVIAVAMVIGVWRTRRAERRARRQRRHPSFVYRPDAETVKIELVTRVGGGRWWRIEAPHGAGPTVLDILSYRRRGQEDPSRWQHEQLDEPLALRAGQPVYLQAPPPSNGDWYDVSVAWTTTEPTGKRTGSDMITVRTEPDHY